MNLTIDPAQRAALKQGRVLDSMVAGREVNERQLIEVLAELVLTNTEVDPRFQSAVNAVIAKASIRERLPSRKKGAKIGEGHASHQPDAVAARFYNLLDGGLTSGAAIRETADKVGLSVRAVERLVKEGRQWYSAEREGREQQRRSNRILHGVEELLPVCEPPELEDFPLGLAGLEKEKALRILSDSIHAAFRSD
ncbi:MAG: hypothetical protein EOP81_02215 [Variovorax sp.]|nr:MAG: hypothetical protein EOP81_02215 [Variovorax sp.]